MHQILIVEDDPALSQGIRLALGQEGRQFVQAGTIGQAERELAERTFDLLILDLNLPDGNGLDLLSRLRDRSALPVLILTANDLEMDQVTGLELGADDYVTKPFSPSELVARVDAIHRRVTMASQQQQTFEITSGPFVINQKSRTLTKNGKLIDLTQVEYQIMEYFLNNQNTALDRASILNHIWGDGYFGDDKIVDVNIRRIRMKIEEEPSKPQYITTIWGYGYKWNDK